MMRVITSVDKSVVSDDDYITPVVLADSVAQDVLSDITTTPSGSPNIPNYECVSRYIQNVGNNDAYVAFGFDATAVEYQFLLKAGAAQLACNDSGQRVSVFSVGGTTIARAVFIRKDMTKQKGSRAYA